MARVVVLQRIVPSYRMPVFRRLADELGWQIVFGRNMPSDNLALGSGEPFSAPGRFQAVEPKRLIALCRTDAADPRYVQA